MSNPRVAGAAVIMIAAVILVVFAAGFMLNVLQGGFGPLVSIMSVVAFGGSVVALIASFSVFRRMRNAN
jgi:hypothetical protein